MKINKEIIKKIPKTDLHVHPSGSMKPETILEIADKYKIKLPVYDLDKIKKYLVKKNTESLEEYLSAFEIPTEIMQTDEGIYRSIYELCEDAHKENVWYMEVRVAPVLYTRRGLNETEIIDIVLDALSQAERDFKMKTGLIISAIRHLSPEITYETAKLAVMYKNRGVIGFDLAGAERNYPAKYHKEAFQLVLNNNLNCTIHAGEAYGPESISQALHYCGAHRLGHASRLIEDGDLLNYVNDHRIPLEICLSSNKDTKAVDNLKHHPFKLYYDYGLRVTLNTDNRTVSDTTITDEYFLAAKLFDLSLEDLKNIAIYGFKSTFQPYAEKVKLLRKALDKMKKIKLPDERSHLIENL